MAKAVVIGGNGFIGSHLVDALVSTGHEVTAFDRFSTSDRRFASPDVRIVPGDFLSNSDLESAVRGQDIVFHFLSTTTPATAESDPTMDIRTNVAQTIELLDAASKAGVEHVYFSSTGGAIYGPQNLPVYAETSRAMPVSPYGIGKLTIEHYLAFFRATRGLESTSLRISNPFGPHQRPQARQGLIPIALRNIALGKPVIRYGDGSMVRDYVYIMDAVEMIMRMVGKPHPHSIYNIGSGHGLSVTEVLAAIERVVGHDFTVDEVPAPATFVDLVVLDTARYVTDFGTVEFTALDEGIRRTFADITDGL